MAMVSLFKDAVRSDRSAPNNTAFSIFDYSDFAPSSASNRPNCKLVRQAPNSVIEPHFHVVNQFQVIVAGNGTLGRTPITPIAVHYASAFTSYGPICSEEHGIDYFTFRDGVDPGARFMPGARSELRGDVRRRHALSSISSPKSLSETACKSHEIEETLFEEEDGLFASFVRLSPSTAWQSSEPALGAGQFCLVVNGKITERNTELGRNDCIYVGKDEAPLIVTTGAMGAEILLMQFPQTPE